MRALAEQRWLTIAQDEKTSIIFGMPAAAIELDAARVVRPIGEIAGEIARRLATPKVAR